MSNVLEVEINPNIELNEYRIKGMPYDLKQHLLVTITIAMERYECDWKDLTWNIKINDGQPIINVKRIKTKKR